MFSKELLVDIEHRWLTIVVRQRIDFVIDLASVENGWEGAASGLVDLPSEIDDFVVFHVVAEGSTVAPRVDKGGLVTRPNGGSNLFFV